MAQQHQQYLQAERLKATAESLALSSSLAVSQAPTPIVQATSGLHLPQLTSSSLATSSLLQSSHPASAQLSEKTHLPTLSNTVHLQL